MRNHDQIMELYDLWLHQVKDQELLGELKSIETDRDEIQDRFFKDLTFGTGGLRGVLGAGTNRMNRVVVGKATQGLANYLKTTYASSDNVSIAISYDSRHKSEDFAKLVAEIMSGNGIKVYMYSRLMPTPCLSFAVRELCCNAGVMITASHNPAQYNGYKVYGNDGCQITDNQANAIYNCIKNVNPFKDVNTMDFDDGLNQGMIQYIDNRLLDQFIEHALEQSPLDNDELVDKSVSIVYSPLHGTGREPVVKTLSRYGFTKIKMVESQEYPDGDFTTCPYPNPEIRSAMEEGIESAKQAHADLLIATDPDCDRVGIAVKNNGDYQLLTGNEVGVLLLDFICSQRIKTESMPNHPVFVKTIVTTDMAEKIATNYGVETRNVLTGFKYIGEQIGLLEKENRVKDFILGFEESYGYLSGSYARDKDGVVGAFLIALMFAFYKKQGISLVKKLENLYSQYGLYHTTLETKDFEGESGLKQFQVIMNDVRKCHEYDGKKVIKRIDYLIGVDNLPKSDVVKLFLADGSSVVIRPSGTEPKLKIYRQTVARR